MIQVHLSQLLYNYIIDYYLRTNCSQTFRAIIYLFNLSLFPFVIQSNISRSRAFTLSACCAVFRVWSFCGSVWQDGAFPTPMAASWLTRWDWGRHCSASHSCGLSLGKVLISGLRLIKPLWSPHPAWLETGTMKWPSGLEGVYSLWLSMVAPRRISTGSLVLKKSILILFI